MHAAAPWQPPLKICFKDRYWGTKTNFRKKLCAETRNSIAQCLKKKTFKVKLVLFIITYILKYLNIILLKKIDILNTTLYHKNCYLNFLNNKKMIAIWCNDNFQWRRNNNKTKLSKKCTYYKLKKSIKFNLVIQDLLNA